MAMATVMPNSKKNLPMTPFTEGYGHEDRGKETVAAMAAKAISFEPFEAASRRLSPSSAWRWMFSMIIMASSITTPSSRGVNAEHGHRIQGKAHEIREYERTKY